MLTYLNAILAKNLMFGDGILMFFVQFGRLIYIHKAKNQLVR